MSLPERYSTSLEKATDFVLQFRLISIGERIEDASLHVYYLRLLGK